MISFLILIIEKDGLVVFNTVSIILIGLVIGSFLNVLIYRLPLNISLFNPKRSHCTKCKEIIPWYFNIPFFSYLYLKGKCHNCNEHISLSYPTVEIITSFLTYILFMQIGLSYELYFLLCITYILIILSFIDFEYKAVPTSLLLLLMLITIAYLSLYNINSLSIFFIFIGGIVTIDFFVTFYIQNIKAVILKQDILKEQRAIGEGDIPIIGMIGGILSFEFGVVAVFLSAVLAIIPSLINKVLKKEIETPFIPFLSLGFIITYTNKNNIQNILEGLNLA